MFLSFSGLFVAFLAATISSIALFPVGKYMASLFGVVDLPDGKRKLQSGGVPLSGGPTIYIIVVVLGTVGVLFVPGNASASRLWLSLLLPASFVFLVGLYDDLYISSARAKLLLQVLGATIGSVLVLGADVHISLFNSQLLNWAVGVLWIVLLTNAFNLIDNTDGHSGSILLVTSLAYSVIAALNGQWLIASLAGVLTGSSVGFLLWNWNPARVYLGDSGALFIGFLLATLSLRIDLTTKDQVISAAVPIVVFLVPLMDTSVAVLGRIQRGVSPFTAGRDHLAHRLMLRANSPKQAVLMLAAFSLVNAIFAVAIVLGSKAQAGTLLLFTSVLFLIGVFYFLRIRLPM